MILVDTSVLIDFLKGKNNPKVGLLGNLLDQGIPWGINELIYQEILQGARDDREFQKLKEYFDTFPMYSLGLGRTSYEEAARLNLRCRAAGVTIRSTIDLLIAQTCLEHDLSLLHHDSDFTHMARVIPEFREYRG